MPFRLNLNLSKKEERQERNSRMSVAHRKSEAHRRSERRMSNTPTAADAGVETMPSIASGLGSGSTGSDARASVARASVTDRRSRVSETVVQRMSVVVTSIKSTIMVGLFTKRLRQQQLTKLKDSKKVGKQVQTLWQAAAADYMSDGRWTLRNYQNYHLSLYFFLNSIDPHPEPHAEMERSMLDTAWQSGLDDWESDTAGRKQLNYGAFFDSIFELTSLYTEERTEKAFVSFLKQVRVRLRVGIGEGIFQAAPVSENCLCPSLRHSCRPRHCHHLCLRLSCMFSILARR